MAKGHRNKKSRARKSTSPFNHNRAAAANRNYERFAQAPQQPAPQPSCFQENLEATRQEPEETIPRTRGPSSERHAKQGRISKSRSRSQSPQRPVSRQASEGQAYKQGAQPSSSPADHEQRSAYRSRSPQRRSSSQSPTVARTVIKNRLQNGGVNDPIVIDDDEDDMPPVNEARAPATPRTVRRYSPDDQQIGIPNAQQSSPKREASAEADTHAAAHVLAAGSPAIPGRNTTPTPPPPQRHIQTPPRQVQSVQASPPYPHHISPVARSPAPVPSPRALHAAQTPSPPQYHRDAAPVGHPPAPHPSPPPQLRHDEQAPPPLATPKDLAQLGQTHRGKQALPPLATPKDLAQLGQTHRGEQALPPLSPHHTVHNTVPGPLRLQLAAADGPQNGPGDGSPTEPNPLMQKEFHGFPPWVWENFYDYNLVMLNKGQLMELPVAINHAVGQTNNYFKQLKRIGIMFYQLASHPAMRLTPAQNNWQPVENWLPAVRGQTIIESAALPYHQPIGGQPAARRQAIEGPTAPSDLQLIRWQPADREQAAVGPAARPNHQPIGGQPAARRQAIRGPNARPDPQLIEWLPEGWGQGGVDPAARADFELFAWNPADRRRRIVDLDERLDWYRIIDAAILYVRQNPGDQELSGGEPYLWDINYRDRLRLKLLDGMDRNQACWEAATETNASYRDQAARALERSRRTDRFGNQLPVDPLQQFVIEAGLINERDAQDERDRAVPDLHGYPQGIWDEKYREYFKEHCQHMDRRQAKLAATVSANTELKDMGLQVLSEYVRYLREKELEDSRHRQLVTPYYSTRGGGLVVAGHF